MMHHGNFNTATRWFHALVRRWCWSGVAWNTFPTLAGDDLEVARQLEDCGLLRLWEDDWGVFVDFERHTVRALMEQGVWPLR